MHKLACLKRPYSDPKQHPCLYPLSHTAPAPNSNRLYLRKIGLFSQSPEQHDKEDLLDYTSDKHKNATWLYAETDPSCYPLPPFLH